MRQPWSEIEACISEAYLYLCSGGAVVSEQRAVKGACQRHALAHTHHRRWPADTIAVLYAPSQQDGWSAGRRSSKEGGGGGGGGGFYYNWKVGRQAAQALLAAGGWEISRGRRMPSAEADINLFFLTHWIKASCKRCGPSSPSHRLLYKDAQTPL